MAQLGQMRANSGQARPMSAKSWRSQRNNEVAAKLRSTLLDDVFSNARGKRIEGRAAYAIVIEPEQPSGVIRIRIRRDHGIDPRGVIAERPGEVFRKEQIAQLQGRCKVDFAVKVNVAEFVLPDIEVRAVDLCCAVKLPVGRGDDAWPGLYGCGNFLCETL